MKALVVDPSRVFQEVIAGVLRDAGGEAIAVYTGAEGLRSFSEVSVDLACVAYHLPDMDGVEFCRQLRALSKRPHVPVVLLTSSEDSEVVSCGLQAGIT
jgi:CheY-like chemotaxis protein